jgi:methyl-accepting chemotaxis protein
MRTANLKSGITLRRLFTYLLIAAGIAAAIALAAVFRTTALQKESVNVENMRYESFRLAAELQQNSDELTRLARTYVVTGNPKYEQHYLDIIDIQDGKKPRPSSALVLAPGQTIALEELLHRAGFVDEEFALLKEAKARSDALIDTEVKAMNAVKGLYADGSGGYTRHGEPDLAMARDLLHNEEYHRVAERINQPIQEFLAHMSSRTSEAVEQKRSTGRRMQMVVTGIVILALSAVILVLLLLYRRLIHQLGGEPHYAAAIIGKIAGGDLTVNIDLNAADRSSLLFSMEAMRQSLARIVADIRNGTDAIDNGSAEIASGNRDLSTRTEQQAGALEETASSMEELTATVQQNVENARQASDLAATASGTAARGGEVVSRVVSTMAQINEASKKITDIISVIDSIAFQTNILALNAAVEAARAGEQGRGFAVVATEVRSLAQRSAAAAKEIKSLINDSTDKVDAGSVLVAEAGATMHDVVSGVRQVADLMTAILSSSQEQGAGIEQVNQAVSEMDEATQQNAALVEQVAAASESLQVQASKLKEIVGQFRVEPES